jgi:hypothetical protein
MPEQCNTCQHADKSCPIYPKDGDKCIEWRSNFAWVGDILDREKREGEK